MLIFLFFGPPWILDGRYRNLPPRFDAVVDHHHPKWQMARLFRKNVPQKVITNSLLFNNWSVVILIIFWWKLYLFVTWILISLEEYPVHIICCYMVRSHIIGSFDHYAYVHDATQSSKIQKNWNQFFEIPKMDFKNKRCVFTCTFPMMVRKVLSLAWNSFL